MYRGLAALTNQEVIKDGHLYEKYSLEDEVDTSRFTVDARLAMKDVLSRGKVPIVEGGSLFHHV